MKTKEISKQLTCLIVAVMLIFGCKENMDQNSAETVSSASKDNVSLNDYGTKAGCVDCEATTSKSSRSTSQRMSPRDSISPVNTVYDTDYLSVGVGGLRGVGSGEIKVTGTFPLSSVTKAILYWHGVTNQKYTTDYVSFQSNVIYGQITGVSSSNCWPYKMSAAVKADVTSIVKSSASRNFKFSNLTEGLDLNGASLILFYSDGNSNNNRDIVFFEGNDAITWFPGYVDYNMAPYDEPGWDILLSGIKYTSGKAMLTLHVADGQKSPDAPLFVNGKKLGVSDHVFDGKSVPGGFLWDIIPIDVSAALSPGVDSLNLTSQHVDDCYSLVVAVFNLPKGAAPRVPKTKLNVDFRPLHCPNTFPDGDAGLVEAAIIGPLPFEWQSIDEASVKLNGIPFTRRKYAEVGSPSSNPVVDCSTCLSGKLDQKTDVVFLFDAKKLLKTFGPVKNGQCVKVTLTANYYLQDGGTLFEGSDYVVIKK